MNKLLITRENVKGLQNVVARITLNRPEVHNAFDEELIQSLTHAFTTLGSDPTVRVIVLAANGASFCAGADLNWMRRMANYSLDENRADAKLLANMLLSISECPKPTIVRIQGDAFAGGIGLVAACDLAVCAENVQFCLSEVKLGLVPAVISPYLMRLMSPRSAKRFMLTAERFDARTAQQVGLINEVVHLNELDALIQLSVETLITTSPSALERCKQLWNDVLDHPIDDALISKTIEHIAQARTSEEGQHGIQSFLQKKQARWSI